MSVVIQPEDKKYLLNDPNFNPERNKAIINETIQETTNFFKSLADIHRKDEENRIDILSSYGRYRFNTGTKGFDEYIGKDLYRQIIGEKILSKVRVMDSVNKLNQNTGKFSKSILI